MVGTTERFLPSRSTSVGSEFKLRRMFFMLHLALLPFIFMIVPSVNVVRGFSTVSPATVNISDKRNDIIGYNKRKTVAIGGRTTTTLKAGLFGEQSFANKKDNAYILPTSVSDVIDGILA